MHVKIFSFQTFRMTLKKVTFGEEQILGKADVYDRSIHIAQSHVAVKVYNKLRQNTLENSCTYFHKDSHYKGLLLRGVYNEEQLAQKIKEENILPHFQAKNKQPTFITLKDSFEFEVEEADEEVSKP